MCLPRPARLPQHQEQAAVGATAHLHSEKQRSTHWQQGIRKIARPLHMDEKVLDAPRKLFNERLVS